MPFSQSYRKVLWLPAKSPTALLYLPQTMAGIGLPRISDRAQIMKWESFLRCTAVHGDSQQSVESFFDRVPQEVQESQDIHVQILSCPAPGAWPNYALTTYSGRTRSVATN